MGYRRKLWQVYNFILPLGIVIAALCIILIALGSRRGSMFVEIVGALSLVLCIATMLKAVQLSSTLRSKIAEITQITSQPNSQ